MKTYQIIQLVHNRIPESQILETRITINEHNHQLDKLQIIFHPETHPDLNLIGTIIQDIENLTIEDEYGDMTELQFLYSTYHELPDENLTVSWTFLPSIDS